jgi:glycosyltransferase involved in cell wall biosynthesis
MTMRVIHILSGLFQGGAESQLEKLIYFSKNKNIEHIIISLKSDETPLMTRLMACNIKVHTLGFSSVFSSIAGVVELRKILKELSGNDTVIQCWMYHANLVGLLVAKSLGLSKKVVWNIRRTELPKGLTGLLATFSAKLSHFIPVKIVCCAEAAKKSHLAAGYCAENMVVIHNGIDVTLFRPSSKNRANFRHEVAVTENVFVIGMVGRYTPIKGHLCLLQAFEKLLIEYKKNIAPQVNIKLVLVGRDIENAEPLQSLLNNTLVKESLILLAERADIAKVMTGFDLLCLPSLSEGFPNVVAEAMASGTPALVTDVGDAAIIVGDDLMVIPSNATIQMAAKLAMLVSQNKQERVLLAENVRARIVTNFSITQAWKNYYQLYRNL